MRDCVHREPRLWAAGEVCLCAARPESLGSGCVHHRFVGSLVREAVFGIDAGLFVLLRGARCRTEIQESIRSVVGCLFQPVFTGTESQRELIQELVVNLAENRGVVLATRITLRPDEIIRPGTHLAADRGGGQARGIGIGDEEERSRARIEGAHGAAEVVNGIPCQAQLLGGLIVITLAIPEEGLIGQRRRLIEPGGTRQSARRTIGRILEIVRMPVEIARGRHDVEAVAVVMEIERGQSPSVHGVRLNVEGAIQRIHWLESGQRCERGWKPMHVGVLVHHAKPCIEAVSGFEEHRHRAAVGGLSALIADAGARHHEERIAGRRTRGVRRKCPCQVAGVVIAEHHHAKGQNVRTQDDVADDTGAGVGAAASGCPAGLHHVAEIIAAQVGLLGHDAHIAAKRALPVKGPLGSLEHFDVVDVEDSRIHRAGHRCIVDIKARGARGAEQVLAGDAANRDRSGVRDAGRTAAVGK